MAERSAPLPPPPGRLALIGAGDLDAPLAWRAGRPLSRRQYLADAQALAGRLADGGPMLNLTGDRYRFAVGLGAALLRGQANLMPPNHTPDTLARLARLFPAAYAIADDAAGAAGSPLPTRVLTDTAADPRDAARADAIDGATLAALVLTSGSTGEPVPHAKTWSGLVRNTEAGARRLARHLGRADLDGVTLVATVPAQHMYGFESSLLLALHGAAAFDAQRPFFPADIVQALRRVPRPRVLVTTPFHLRTLLDAAIALPAVDALLCATAPLPPQLAAQAEAGFDAPLVEIYGCTEAGQVATRRTTDGPEWHTFDGLVLRGDGAAATVSGGHVAVETPLADVLDVIDAAHFRLLGRSNDMVNVAGKRSSLGALNHHLNSLPGVRDGAFFVPPGADAGAALVRLAAFVVAPGIGVADILAGLRDRIDPAFLPRPVVHVDELPREPTGKLAATRFAEWAAARLAGPARP